jgi:hypothetical protein
VILNFKGLIIMVDKTSLKKFLGIISNPSLNGVCSIVSIMLGVLSSSFLIRTIFFILSAFLVLYIFHHWVNEKISMVYKWLTRKFFLGLVVGIVIGSIVTPMVIEPVVPSLLSVVAPKVQLNGSYPKDGETLAYANSQVMIEFNKSIPWPYYNFVNVDLSPSIHASVYWADPEHNELFIKANKIFPLSENGGVDNPRFDFDTTYKVEVKAPFIIKPVIIKFNTPNK